MTKPITEFWMGTEETLPLYLSAIEKANDRTLEVQARGLYDEDEENTGTYLLDVEDGVATITVEGPILSYSNEFTRWLGLVGYPDIREALVEAATDDSVREIFMHYDTPGGSAKGVEDVSALISRINAEYKPVTAYTSGTMASAGYYLAASAGKIYAAKMADVGSIGVTATHFEVTKQLEKFGVKATVFRSGEFKALGGPYEELSATATDMIQGRLDAMYDEFILHVANGRGQSPQYVREYMAEGREFFGKDALKVHLIDGIMSVDEVVAKLRTSAKQKSNSALLQAAPTAIKTEIEMAKKKVLDDKTVAEIAAGVDPEQAISGAPEVEDDGTVAPEAQAQAPAPAEEQEPVTVALEAISEDSGLIGYLKEQLSSEQQKSVDLTMQVKELTAKVESMTSTHSQLMSIAQDFVSVRMVALGRPSTDLSSLSAETLIQQFNKVTEEFHKTFPVGGKCSLPSTEPPQPLRRNHKSAVNASKI